MSFREISSKTSKLKILMLVMLVLSALSLPVHAAGISTLENVDCVIYPSEEADIGSGSVGVLESLLVDRSEFVKEGDALAQLESSAEQAAVTLATARANAAAEVNFRQLSADHSKRQATRIEQLVADNSVSAKDLDDRKTEAQLGEQQLLKAVENKNILALELARAKVALEKRTIRSPFSGVVVERYKSVGEYVDSDPVMRIVQLHPLHIETIIPAEHVGEIRAGMQANVVSADNPDQSWTAEVDRVDSVVDVASATFGVRLELPNPDFEITAGLRCRLSFVDDQTVVSSVADSIIRNPPQLESNQQPKVKTTSDVGSTSVVPALAAVKIINDADSAAAKQVGDVQAVNAILTQKLICINDGPYNEYSIAEEHMKYLSQRGNDVEIVTKLVSEKKGYLVMSPEFASREDAEFFVSSLETAGITDSFLPSNITPVRVSIGAFSQHEAATTRTNQLSLSGISSEIRPWEKSLEKYYVIGRSGQSPMGTDCELPAANEDGAG